MGVAKHAGYDFYWYSGGHGDGGGKGVPAYVCGYVFLDAGGDCYAFYPSVVNIVSKDGQSAAISRQNVHDGRE